MILLIITVHCYSKSDCRSIIIVLRFRMIIIIVLDENFTNPKQINYNNILGDMPLLFQKCVVRTIRTYRAVLLYECTLAVKYIILSWGYLLQCVFSALVRLGFIGIIRPDRAHYCNILDYWIRVVTNGIKRTQFTDNTRPIQKLGDSQTTRRFSNQLKRLENLMKRIE